MPHQDEITPRPPGPRPGVPDTGVPVTPPSAPAPTPAPAPAPAPPSGGGGAATTRTQQQILDDFFLFLTSGGTEGTGANTAKAELTAIGSDPALIDDQLELFKIQEGLGVDEETFETTEDIFDPFLLQEEAPRDVFTRFLNEFLGGVSPLIRNRAGGQFGNLFNQFSTGVLGGIAGRGGDFEEDLGGEGDLFANFLRGGPRGQFFESDPSRALRNIGALFGSEEDTSGFINQFFDPTSGAGRNRISGAITSPIAQSINPFFRNAFQTGFRSDLDRLLADDPGANPFSAFGGFF